MQRNHKQKYTGHTSLSLLQHSPRQPLLPPLLLFYCIQTQRLRQPLIHTHLNAHHNAAIPKYNILCSSLQLFYSYTVPHTGLKTRWGQELYITTIFIITVTFSSHSESFVAEFIYLFMSKFWLYVYISFHSHWRTHRLFKRER